jgi:predicted ATP-grasp superfamily ATP-dependent carboligase
MRASEIVAVVLCEGTNGLSVIRGLARVGVPTVALAADRGEIALWSRYPARKLCLPAVGRPEGMPALLEFLHTLPGAVLIPTADRHVDLLSAHRAALAECCRFCLPPENVVRMLLDKRTELRHMQQIGIPIPRSVLELPPSAGELERLLPYPLIVKPRSFAYQGTLVFKTLLIRGRPELDDFYQGYRERLDGLIAQEVIPGDDSTLWKCDCTFNQRSEMIVAFTFHKLRMIPAHFGVASLAESAGNPGVAALVARLGAQLAYTGPANVEFKFDRRDGEYKYIEINPRLGLLNYFDAVCGVNNAWYTYRLARGEELERLDVLQRDGVIYCNLFDDLYSRLKDQEPLRRIVGHYLSLWNRLRVGAYFNWRDPLPGVIQTGRWGQFVCRSLARKVRSN